MASLDFGIRRINRHLLLVGGVGAINEHGCAAYLDRMFRIMGSSDRPARTHIINEANLTGGENVGGATASPTAPEASSDDDDGGDPDPEPERHTRRHRNAISFTVEHFGRLPDSAKIDLPSLRAITGKSRPTIYRWIDKGILPKPHKLGPTYNFWTAGEIRRALQIA